MRNHAVPLSLAFVLTSCNSRTNETTREANVETARVGVAVVDSATAVTEVNRLRGRFVCGSRSLLPLGAFGAFQQGDGTHLRAVLPEGASKRVLRSADVALPIRAKEAAHLTDVDSGMEIRFTLAEAADVPVETANGVAVYRNAIMGGHLLHRIDAGGTEDFVVLDRKPAHEELVYHVDVSRVAGLRLVSNTLEFVDATGTPRLRMAPPWIVDAKGELRDATTTVMGCAYDTDTSGPWDRPVTAPGAERCIVKVSWNAVEYPAMVDPSWTTTGSMIKSRAAHTATLLSSGKVLIAGGGTENELKSSISDAELFDGVGSFAATASMSTPRAAHTATLLASGQVLIVGGRDYSSATAKVVPRATAEIYNGSAFSATGSMGSARWSHTATLLSSGTVLVAGGGTNGGGFSLSEQATAEIFNAGSFSPTGSMSAARRGHTATLLPSGKVLITGGATGNTGLSALSGAELFNGSGFTTTGSMSKQRGWHTATLLSSGKVLVVGGYGGGTGSTYTGEVFDGVGAFAAAISSAGGFDHQASVSLGGDRVLLIGEYGSVYNGTTFLGAKDYGSNSAAAVRLPSGKVLATGGKVTFASGTEGADDHAQLFAAVASGGACEAPGDCASGICEDFVCCAAVCTGTCVKCGAGTGACVPRMGEDDDSCKGTMTCDATAKCKLKNGQPATVASNCASGIIADGVCCEAACTGACEACNKPGSTGLCAKDAAGSAGTPSCSPFVCTGASDCPTACTADSACAAGFFCNSTGACELMKAKGTSCDLSADCKVAGCRECSTGYCVDGTCCATTCTGACSACSAAKSGVAGSDGTCVFIADTRDPDNECAGASTCVSASMTDEVCNGSGGCRSYTKSCAPFGCDPSGKICLSKCTMDAECGADGYCPASGTCAARKDRGEACSATSECKTAMYCVDGVCCDKACGGQCEACNEPGSKGLCVTVAGPPRSPRASCAGADGCAGSCDGTNPAVCAYPSAGKSCGAGCSDAKLSVCDATGNCLTAAPCAGGFACDGTTRCKVECAVPSDCALGYVCTAGKCIPKPSATCSSDLKTSKPGDGSAEQTCFPYKCNSDGTCRTTCATTSECDDNAICNVATAHCDQNPVPDEGGCSLSTRRASTNGGMLAAVLGLAIALRRRRSARSLPGSRP